VRILLTNDDGYDAPGLRALHEAVGGLPGVEVSVIAPAVAQSGKGHSITARFTCRRVAVEPMGSVVVIDGTPADCVRAALHLPGHPRPDWVIAGINHGSNLGIDIYYSATVAAVREAAILGVPAISVSQLVKPQMTDDWSSSTRQAAAVIAAICSPQQAAPPGVDAEIHRLAQAAIQNQGLSAVALSADQPVAAVRPILAPPRRRRPATPCWNVNLPRLPDGQPPHGVRLAPVSIDPLEFTYDHAVEGQESVMTYVGRYHERPASPETDVAWAFAGYITLSQMKLG